MGRRKETNFCPRDEYRGRADESHVWLDVFCQAEAWSPERNPRRPCEKGDYPWVAASKAKVDVAGVLERWEEARR